MATLDSRILALKGMIDDLSIYQRKGKTVVRYRYNVRKKRKPTPEQMRTRLAWANVYALWRAFPEGRKPLFQGRRPGTTDQNMFVSHNMHNEAVYLTRPQLQSGGSVVTTLAVSDGTLRPIKLRLADGRVTTNIKTGGWEPSVGSTVGEMAAAILEHNEAFQPCDILRHYVAKQYWDVVNQMPRTRVECTDLPLDPHDERLLADAVGNCCGFGVADGHIAATSEVEGGMAWVHMSKKEETTLVSPQRLLCTNAYMAQYGSEEAFEAACLSYGVKRNDIDNN